MATATELLDQQFLEMRWRCLTLAADFDRIARAPGGAELIRFDDRLARLRDALRFIAEPGERRARAEFVQMLFSDQTPRHGSDRQSQIGNRQ